MKSDRHWVFDWIDVFRINEHRFDLFSAYGSLSIIIITLIWMYYSMYILYLGAYLNTLWPANAPGQGESSSL